MGPFEIVKFEVGVQALEGIAHLIVVFDVDFFVLHCPPQALDENVVDEAPNTIHADLNIGVLQAIGEVSAGELRALIAVENVRFAVGKRCIERLNAKASVKRVPGELLLGLELLRFF